MLIIDTSLVELMFGQAWREHLDAAGVKYEEHTAMLMDGSTYTRPVLMVDGDEYMEALSEHFA